MFVCLFDVVFRRRQLLQKSSTSTLTPLLSSQNGLDSDKSCIQLELSVSVENILPDPTSVDVAANIWILGESGSCAMEEYGGIATDASGTIMIPGKGSLEDKTGGT